MMSKDHYKTEHPIIGVSARGGRYGWLNLDDMLIYRERDCYTVNKITARTLKCLFIEDYGISSLTREDRLAIWGAYVERYPYEYRW